MTMHMKAPRVSRRLVLRGVGGFTLALPLLESVGPRRARAAGEDEADPFAIFLRQANGVACFQETEELGDEPERFWPTDYGTLTAERVEGRAVGELSRHLSHLLVVHNVNMVGFDYGDGHARGAMQGLTARGPVVEGVGGASEAAGESIDHRIGAELNEGGRESLFLYAGVNDGWLGGPCISYRAPGARRAALRDPMEAYRAIMGVDASQFAELVARQRSINDLVRGQMAALLAKPRLSQADRDRLELHRAAIRDLETALACNFADDQLRELEGQAASYDSEDGDETLAAARAHIDVAALAVACGYTRSVAIQIGNGHDGYTRYRNLETGELMENYHYISHRRQSHDAEGDIIPNSDVLHHYVDVQFARTFAHLLDRLSEYSAPSGRPLLDAGVAIWYNDNGNGPGHSPANIPVVIAGSAGGYFRQGEYIRAEGGDWEPNHNKLLNTIGAAVGLTNADGGPLDDFGDPELPKGILSELLA